MMDLHRRSLGALDVRADETTTKVAFVRILLLF